MSRQEQPKKIVNDSIRSDAKNRKAIITYVIVFMIINIPAGMISIANLNAYFPGFLVIACQVLAFLALGVLHISLLKKYITFPNKFPANNKLILSVLISLLTCFVLVLIYLIKDSNMIRMAFANSCAFLLPSIVHEVWQAYNNVPEKEYSVWYNSDGVIDNRTTVFLNSVPIRLQLAMRYFDIKDEVFELTVPGHTQFGKFFNQFIIEKNKNAPAIECVDMEKKPFGWQFYTERLWGLNRQFIDPELSLRENKVSDHSTITAKRKRSLSEPPKENAEKAEWKALPLINQNKPVNKHEAKK